MSQNLNVLMNDWDLKSLLDLVMAQVKTNMNCMHIGIIKSFDSEFQTAQVQIAYNSVSLQQTGNVFTTKSNTYPLLLSCPVIFPGNALTYFTWPVSVGDECLVLFNDRDLSNWWGTGTTGADPNTGRIHSFTDAVVIPGIRSFYNTIDDFDGSATVITYGSNTVALGATSYLTTIGTSTISLSASAGSINVGTATVALSTTQIKIGNTTTTLGAALQSLLTDIQSLITALTANSASFILVTGAPGGPSPINPAIPTALTAVSTSLSTLSTELSSLLE